MTHTSHPFDPLIDCDTKVLILGTFPSIKSCAEGFYYAHPKNQFWKLLYDVYAMPTQTLDEKRVLLHTHHLGLWDIVASCVRTNSSDTNLHHITPNDIPALLCNYPNIGHILFTSKTAEKIFEKHFGKLEIIRGYLPSPSPAYASMKYEEKLEVYQKVLGF